jgi:2-desacetyl-2-hydroxyethyl bacteriochlorophyllide A dehydrogenase
MTTTSRAIYFTAPGQVELREEKLSAPAPGQALVQTLTSGISPGSELLIYRGQFPADLAVDESIAALSGQFAFPLKYGYSAVGRVIALGEGVPDSWMGQVVFAFHPHESHFLATPAELIPIPSGFSAEEALFLPNMETAVTFLLDGRPLIGEQVAVFGQGIVGLLTAALLSRLPLASLVTLDKYPKRREASLRIGAAASLDPATPDALDRLRTHLQADRPYRGADLVYELSGAPAALDQAIAAAGYHGRVVIGSWYGSKPATLHLGGRFHRDRIRLIGSQVSTIAPSLRGRWDTARRLGTAWEMIRAVEPTQLITHRFPIGDAAQAYDLLDQQPDRAIQVVFTY